MLKDYDNKKVKPDYRVIVRMNDIESVRCEVFLPHNPGTSLELHLHTDEKLDSFPVKFSIEGDVIGFDGNPEMKIKADTVYLRSGFTSYWSKDVPDTVVIGTPTSLTVTEYFNSDQTQRNSDRVYGHFMVQPWGAFPFMKSLEKSYTGEINVNQLGEYKFTISPDVKLTFNEFYKYRENEIDGFVCIPELVAKFDTDTNKFKEICNFKEIDDLLMLVSFANRQRCMCTGWVASDSCTTRTYYRCGMAVDQPENRRRFFKQLIDWPNWSEYLKMAYERISQLDNEKRGLLRRAINCAISSSNETQEASFTTLYSGIESLVTLFSKEYPASRKVLSKSEWEKFREGYEHLVEKVLSESAEEEIQQPIAQKKQTLSDKLGNINSLPMGSAFEIMADTYQVDLHDLWPVYEAGGKSKDLSWIRNQLSHGSVFAPEKASTLIGAGEHLRWTLERLILGFLGWPVEKSNVSKKFLSQNMACYCDLKEDKAAFKQLL